MKRRPATIATYALLASAAGGSLLLHGHLDEARLQSSAAAGSTLEVVPIELVLLVDTSGSVDAGEYLLQRDGYEEAFRNDDLVRLIERQGGIAVTYVEWSNVDHQDVRLPWTRLDTADDCRAFASQISALERVVEGNTRMAPALEFAANLIETNEYIGLKRVIDVSGDGRCQNHDYYAESSEYLEEYGRPWNDVIADISGKIDQVNGICITTDSTVVDFYGDVLPQGDSSFMMQVSHFGQFEDAIVEKLTREIGHLPGFYD